MVFNFLNRPLKKYDNFNKRHRARGRGEALILKMRIMMGLMGVGNDGKILITPKGKTICKVPKWLAWRIQSAQHWVAKHTWV